MGKNMYAEETLKSLVSEIEGAIDHGRRRHYG
jgi:hypothetical protein